MREWSFLLTWCSISTNASEPGITILKLELALMCSRNPPDTFLHSLSLCLSWLDLDMFICPDSDLCTNAPLGSSCTVWSFQCEGRRGVQNRSMMLWQMARWYVRVHPCVIMCHHVSVVLWNSWIEVREELFHWPFQADSTHIDLDFLYLTVSRWSKYLLAITVHYTDGCHAALIHLYNT